MTTIAPEVTAVDDVDWGTSGSTLLYDPKFRFPLDELLALARASARCPGLELRRDMDGDAVARLFGLEGGGDSSGCSRSAARFAGDDQEDLGYVAVEPEEELDLDYVVVGTADEVERERRREAALGAGLNYCVRSIEKLLLDEEETAHNMARRHVRSSVEQFVDLDEADDDKGDARTARLMELVRDIHRFLEEEAAVYPEWSTVVRTIEEHFGVH